MRRVFILAVFAVLVWQAWAQTRTDEDWRARLLLNVVDSETNQPIAARFEIRVDGELYEPRWVGTHGLRFVSVHVSKKQTYVATFARGTGTVEVPLPADADDIELHIAKGFDYAPVSMPISVSGSEVVETVRLRRWNTLVEEGWRAADAHLHYDRPDPEADRDWFHMLAADGLALGQFMVLKGGMVPGVWAQQYAYGRFGEHSRRGRTLVPGMEFRDRLQGHILLFGAGEVIEPIMAGTPEAPHNWPRFVDVLDRARRGDALVGPAHGGTLSRSPTAIADALLGRVDFWEIGNAHLWAIEDWYRLMNVGLILPPVAGTDLPNNPDRESWQPFLGSMRMYAKTGGDTGSEAWNRAVRRGEVFCTSGPTIRISVNGEGPGGVVRLPEGGGELAVEALLTSPRAGLQALEIVLNGKVVELGSETLSDGPVESIVLKRKIRVDQGSWIAARGTGPMIDAIGQSEVAHTAAVKILVGDQFAVSDDGVRLLLDRLRKQRDFYTQEGSYPNEAARRQMLEVFDDASERLREM